MRRAEKPQLEAVLDWADVEYPQDRTTAMVHCPLHEDRRPSLSVNFSKQVFKCQSCGVGGDAWTMIMKVRDVDFRGAVKIATADRIATRDSGDSDDELSGLSIGRGVRVSKPKGNRPGDGSWRPTWRS